VRDDDGSFKYRVETLSQGGNNKVYATSRENVVAKADLQTQGTVDVLLEITAVGMRQCKALHRQEKQDDRQHEILVSTPREEFTCLFSLDHRVSAGSKQQCICGRYHKSYKTINPINVSLRETSGATLSGLACRHPRLPVTITPKYVRLTQHSIVAGPNC
jgi:hypothetical protein